MAYLIINNFIRGTIDLSFLQATKNRGTILDYLVSECCHVIVPSSTEANRKHIICFLSSF